MTMALWAGSLGKSRDFASHLPFAEMSGCQGKPKTLNLSIEKGRWQSFRARLDIPNGRKISAAIASIVCELKGMQQTWPNKL